MLSMVVTGSMKVDRRQSITLSSRVASSGTLTSGVELDIPRLVNLSISSVWIYQTRVNRVTELLWWWLGLAAKHFIGPSKPQFMRIITSPTSRPTRYGTKKEIRSSGVFADLRWQLAPANASWRLLCSRNHDISHRSFEFR
jgi:hypothetical protein